MDKQLQFLRDALAVRMSDLEAQLGAYQIKFSKTQTLADDIIGFAETVIMLTAFRRNLGELAQVAAGDNAPDGTRVTGKKVQGWIEERLEAIETIMLGGTAYRASTSGPWSHSSTDAMTNIASLSKCSALRSEHAFLKLTLRDLERRTVEGLLP